MRSGLPPKQQRFTVKKDLLMLCTDFTDAIPQKKYVVIKISEDGQQALLDFALDQQHKGEFMERFPVDKSRFVITKAVFYLNSDLTKLLEGIIFLHYQP